MVELAIYIGGIVAVVALLFFIFWNIGVQDWLLCPRCKTRIASVRTWDVTQIGAYRDEQVIKNIRLSNKKVCGDCRKYLDEIGFPIQGTWFIGATVEYVKNTPALFAVVVSMASFALSVLIIFRDRAF